MLFGKNRDSEIGLWLPNCTRCAHTILLTTANFRTLFFPNSTTDPPITYTNSLLGFEIVLWTIARPFYNIGTPLTCDRWVSCAIRNSEIGLWMPINYCTRYAHTILLTTANFRTLFFPNSTTDPPITYIIFIPFCSPKNMILGCAVSVEPLNKDTFGTVLFQR